MLLVGTRLVRARPRLLARRDRHRRGLRPRRPARDPDRCTTSRTTTSSSACSAGRRARSFGESEVALRLWSVIPFLLGVGLVTVWLHVRVSPLSGVLFLFFVTLSPLLLDLSRQARGYGIAFCAMGAWSWAPSKPIPLPSRHVADRGRVRAGVAGTWTLPNFGIAVRMRSLQSLLIDACHCDVAWRSGLALRSLAISCLVRAATSTTSFDASRQDSGLLHRRLAGSSTAPIDQILLPALLWIDGSVVVTPGLVWLPVVAAALAAHGLEPASSGIARRRSSSPPGRSSTIRGPMGHGHALRPDAF